MHNEGGFLRVKPGTSVVEKIRQDEKINDWLAKQGSHGNLTSAEPHGWAASSKG